MRLLDTYAANTGSTIDRPYIYTKFFPVSAKKYITIQAQTPYDSRNYNYWQEVVEIIKPVLEKENIEIVQVGIKDEIKIDKTIDLIGKTDVNQLAYVIQNSILHFGADSFCVHLASYFDKPIVSLYSISNPNVAGPHFGNKDNHILIRAYENVGTKKPSYSQNESPKSINTVKPEEIANSILKLLNLNIKSNHKTLIFGDKFKTGVIEFIPDKILNPEFAQDKMIIMRLDLCKAIDEQIIFQNLKMRKFILFLDNKNKISDQIFKFLKPNIAQIIFNCTLEKPDKKYIQSIVESGHMPFILYKGLDKKYFDDVKIDLIEFNLKFVHEIPNKKLIDDLYKICDTIENKEKLFIKSNRIILSDGNIYLSEQHLLEKKHSTNHIDQLSKLNNPKNLEGEIDFLYIFSA